MSEIQANGWHLELQDPAGARTGSTSSTGKTMVMDKGLGLHAFSDLLRMSSRYIDIIKLGFGTAVLTPVDILLSKINYAKNHGILIMTGGTLLETAVTLGLQNEFLHQLQQFGFNALEVSDGSFPMTRKKRSELILRGQDMGFTVVTEYGKKLGGERLVIEHLVETATIDLELGAEFVIIEGRESGSNAGVYNVDGSLKEHDFGNILKIMPESRKFMWEAPRKEQQVFLLQTLGSNAHLGNISFQDVTALEALRRGLRGDTACWVTKSDCLHGGQIELK